MHVNVRWKAAIKKDTTRVIGNQIVQTLKKLSRGVADWPIQTLEVDVFELGRYGGVNSLLRLVNPFPGCENLDGIPVQIHTEGKHGVKTLIRSPDHHDDILLTHFSDFLSGEKSLKVCSDVVCASVVSPIVSDATAQLQDEVSEAVDHTPGEVRDDVPEAQMPSEAFVPGRRARKPVFPQKGISMYERLKGNSVPDEDIERLKATLASVVDSEMARQKLRKIPNLLQISVEHITAAIYQHMRLSPNGRGSYQGIIANFYSTRITLCALKYEESADKDARYTDWLFDCDIVLDFVGGENNLRALARERQVEVEQEAMEQEKVGELPQTADVLQVALDTDVPYRQILDEAERLAQARAVEERELQLAAQNESMQRDIVSALQEKLADAKQNLETATCQKLAAEGRLKALTPSSELIAKLKGVQDRVLALASKLGF